MSFYAREYYTSSSESSDSHDDIEEGVEHAINIPIADTDPIITDGGPIITNGEPVTDAQAATYPDLIEEADPEPITDIGMWSELSKYITAFTPARLEDLEIEREVRIQLKCEICMDKSIRLPSWVGGLPNYNKHNSETLCVLPCGHFFGRRCMQKWTSLQEHQDAPPVCPKCRYQLIHPKCKHHIKLKMVHTSQLSAINPRSITKLVPLTRVHELNPDNPENEFVDVSLWDPVEGDSKHNFGVTDECYYCEKERMIREWERERELEQGEIPKWWF
ncbi:hypothetical protein O1611_g636 [Lasiodiplodia mahajangana]|uniref:Uncharacterized protein n=1 Tax=Lasiodiplodia mahajangana TaxID=1108764 RepID=A0ACC2K0F2_9PEZI|nr:hypothetical protein O1611_g636 [Lasiodiplodia mahajangana]